jgi:hypothetical protein
MITDNLRPRRPSLIILDLYRGSVLSKSTGHHLLIRPNGDFRNDVHLSRIAFPSGYGKVEVTNPPLGRYVVQDSRGEFFHVGLHSISIGVSGINLQDVTVAQARTAASVVAQIGRIYELALYWGGNVVEPSVWKSESYAEPVPDSSNIYGPQKLVTRIVQLLGRG